MLCVSREEEVGRDVFYCCVCAYPTRDLGDNAEEGVNLREASRPASTRGREVHVHTYVYSLYTCFE